MSDTRGDDTFILSHHQILPQRVRLNKEHWRWAPKRLLNANQRPAFSKSCLLAFTSWFSDLPNELTIDRLNKTPQAYTLHMIYHTADPTCRAVHEEDLTLDTKTPKRNHQLSPWGFPGIGTGNMSRSSKVQTSLWRFRAESYYGNTLHSISSSSSVGRDWNTQDSLPQGQSQSLCYGTWWTNQIMASNRTHWQKHSWARRWPLHRSCVTWVWLLFFLRRLRCRCGGWCSHNPRGGFHRCITNRLCRRQGCAAAGCAAIRERRVAPPAWFSPWLDRPYTLVSSVAGLVSVVGCAGIVENGMGI